MVCTGNGRRTRSAIRVCLEIRNKEGVKEWTTKYSAIFVALKSLTPTTSYIGAAVKRMF